MLDIIRQASLHGNFSFQSKRGLYWDWIHSKSCFVSKSNCDVFWSVSQQVSGRGLYAIDIFLLVQTTVFRRASAHMCVWWQMRGGSHWAHRDRAQNVQSLSSGRLGLIWALQHVPQTLATHSAGILESFVSTLRCQYIHNTHTVSILPVETSKPLRTIICSAADQWSGYTVEEKREVDGQKNVDLKGDFEKVKRQKCLNSEKKSNKWVHLI